MKPTGLILGLLIIVSVVPALSQTHQGSWEFSVSGAFSSFSLKTESSGFGGTHTHESDKATNYFSLLLRPGFYVIDGLEIEPEINWGAADGIPPSFSFSGNIAYTYLIPNTHVAPFALAGYGIGNGIPLLQRMFDRSSDAFDIGVLNLGGGVKWFAGKQVALRVEYRFQRYTHESTTGTGTYSTTQNTTFNFNNVFLGVSVFLP
jgi:opacity protein-like surface antigen